MVEPPEPPDRSSEALTLPGLPAPRPRITVELESLVVDDVAGRDVEAWGAGPPPAPPSTSGTYLPPLDPSLRSHPATHRRPTVSASRSPNSWALVVAGIAVVGILVAIVASSASRSNDPRPSREQTSQPQSSQDQTGFDGSPGTGSTLSVGSETSGQVGSSGTATFTAVGSGFDVAVVVQGVDGFDSTVTVLDAFGDEVAFDDDTNGFDPEAVVFMGSGEQFTIEVRGYSGNAGEFRLSIVDAALSTTATSY